MAGIVCEEVLEEPGRSLACNGGLACAKRAWTTARYRAPWEQRSTVGSSKARGAGSRAVSSYVADAKTSRSTHSETVRWSEVAIRSIEGGECLAKHYGATGAGTAQTERAANGNSETDYSSYTYICPYISTHE